MDHLYYLSKAMGNKFPRNIYSKQILKAYYIKRSIQGFQRLLVHLISSYTKLVLAV